MSPPGLDASCPQRSGRCFRPGTYEENVYASPAYRQLTRPARWSGSECLCRSPRRRGGSAADPSCRARHAPRTGPRRSLRRPACRGDDAGRAGCGARGALQLLSGLHSDRFIVFSEIARDEEALGLLGRWLAPTLAATSPAGVLSPSTAGVALGSVLARELGVPLQLATLDESGRAAGARSQLAIVARDGYARTP